MSDIYLNKINVYSLSHNGMMAYTSLKMELDTRIKNTKEQQEIIIYTNEDFMIYNLLGHMNTTRYFKENLNNGFLELQEYGFIKIIDSNKKNYVLDIKGLYIESGDTYFKTTTEEIRKILNINTKDIFGLFHYAMTILSTIWDNGNGKNFGRDSIEQLCDKSGVQSKVTIVSYNSILEENKILYTHRNEFTNRNENGTIQRQANTYGRYVDKQLAIQASEKYNHNTYDNTKRVESKEKQSIKAKYNSYVKGTYKGSIKELKELVNKYNNDPYIAKYNNQIDFSVFQDVIEEPQEKQLQKTKKNPIIIDIKEPLQEETPKVKNLIKKEIIKPTYEQCKKWGFSEKQMQDYDIYKNDLSICKKYEKNDSEDII
jgi:hypothetical protein